MTGREDVARRAAQAVYVIAENVGRFLDHLKRERRTEKYRRNLRTYLSKWAVPLADRVLRTVTLEHALPGWKTAPVEPGVRSSPAVAATQPAITGATSPTST